MKFLLVMFLWCVSASAQEFVPFFSEPTSTTGNHLSVGLLAFWRFDEASGDAFDSSPNNRTLTENGTPGSGTGVVNGDRIFTDSDETDYFERASESVFGFSGDFTITAWAVFDDAPPNVDDKSVISRGDFDGSNFSWLLAFDSASPNDQISFYWSTDGIFNAGNVISFDLGGDVQSDFYFICVRRTGSTLHISATYITDGSLAPDTTGTSSGAYFEDGTSTLRVGDLEGSDIHDMRGDIDEMGVWSRYLSDCEVAWLFTAGDGTFTYPSFDANTCVNP